LLGKTAIEKGLDKCAIMVAMIIEEIKTKNYRKNKLKILSVFAIILLLFFILFDYVFIVRRSYKALAPTTENQTNNNSASPPLESSKTKIK